MKKILFSTAMAGSPTTNLKQPRGKNMRTLLALSALVISSSALASGYVQLRPGSEVVIAPGEVMTVSCTGNGGEPAGQLYFRCELVWTSTWGDPMPTLRGEGLTRQEAISTITKACNVQPGGGNAQKCAGLAGTAVCKISRI